MKTKRIIIALALLAGIVAAGLCVSDDRKRRASNKTFTK